MALALACLGLAASCDGDAADDAGPGDAGPPPRCDGPAPTFEAGDPEGHPAPLEAGAGEVRAGRLDEARLPADRTGLGGWEEGDFVLANDRVALLVEDAGRSDGYDPFGGRPVGVAAVRDGALEAAGDFNEILFGFGGFLVETEEVTVRSDGADGGPAVIRATGPLGRLEFAGDLLADLLPGDDHTGLPAAMDYEMAPGSDAVEVYLEVGAPTPRGARVPFVLDAFFQRYRMPIWTEDAGFEVPETAVPMAAFVDDEATSYAWIAPEGATLSPILDQSGVLVFSTGRARVPGCETERLHLGTLVLGGPGLGGLQGALARHRGEATRPLTGTVRDAAGAGTDVARIHVRRADGRHYARVRPEPDGTFALDVPPEAITVSAVRPGLPPVGPIDVAADAPEVTIDLPEAGALHVTVTDDASPGAPLPARVQVIPADGAPAPPADLGERRVRHGRSHVEFPADGELTVAVAPGTHDVIVSRGFEYELVTERVTVAAGETAEVSAALPRVVDTTGVMCADYHIHTHRSPDSPDSARLKLTGLIADGLEIPIRSDHEWVRGFQPEIEAMGLDAWAFGIGGEELTTFAWGHFGVFPLAPDPTRPNGSAIPWAGRLPPAVFGDVRARPESPALIINHPRSGGVIGGYFNAAAFDRATATAGNPDHWDADFRLVEVFNDDAFDDVREDEVADWFALLSSGRRVFAVGSSDSHRIFGSPVGYPRTCLELGTDDPRELTADAVRDATLGGHSVVSGGLYLTVAGPGGAGPGDPADGVGEIAAFDVVVQAASWIDGVDTLEVIVDGETTETIPIREADRDPTDPVVRLAATVEVPVAPGGSWVVFHASSSADLAPLHPGRAPFAVSNPVFLSR